MPPTSKSSFSVFTRLSRSTQRYTGEPDWVFPSPNICVNSWEDAFGWNPKWEKEALSILPCRSIINKLCHPKKEGLQTSLPTAPETPTLKIVSSPDFDRTTQWRCSNLFRPGEWGKAHACWFQSRGLPHRPSPSEPNPNTSALQRPIPADVPLQ